MIPGAFDRRLSTVLVVSIAVMAAVAAIAAFLFSLREAREIQDDALRQVAQLRSGAADTSETPIAIARIPPDPAPAWMSRHSREGFHTVRTPAGTLRAYIEAQPSGGWIVVTQDTSLRQDVAVGAALQALVPVLLLIPLVAWLTLRVLHAERSALARERRFIAAAAHELRSPLTAMSLQATNVESAPDIATARERIAAMKTGIDRARRVADQMLVLARLHAVREPPAVVDMAALAREIIADAMPLAATRGIDLGLEERASPEVLASGDALRLVLANGLDNALRYSPEQSAVTVRVQQDAADVIVDIEDEGAGIPPESRAAVFEPFQRLRPEGATTDGGAGLGLAIARDAARKTGGSVELLDGPGRRGLVFRYRQARLAR